MFIIFNNLKTIEYSFTIYISNNTTYLNMGIIVRNECINVHCYRPTFLVLSYLVKFANINVQQIGKHLDGKESLRPLLLENIIMENSGKIKHSLWIYTKFESTPGTAPFNTLDRHLALWHHLKSLLRTPIISSEVTSFREQQNTLSKWCKNWELKC